jgi:hypothetical protein
MDFSTFSTFCCYLELIFIEEFNSTILYHLHNIYYFKSMLELFLFLADQIKISFT